ncbi:HD-GYP domain-containing protein [Ornithinimicrobium avium]|uniref:HD domain-containing protein n=1 Tax=Ornithinimicrobium avium TaxID=2283195 RepID=A0A345NRL7_9MICO|nr:HD domain-containing phosphohydrolase [Ornithinimicrobium avium]AXH97675.1 HD domain-containing protein [Ornithinimicrobium avium]
MRVGIVVFLLAAVAVAGSWWGWRELGPDARLEPDIVVPLVGLGVGGVLLRERNLGPHLGVSVISVVLAAAVALTGPAGAALVGFVAYAVDVHQKRPRTRVFNASMAGAIGAVGGVVYLLVAGGLAVDSPQTVPLLDIGLPLLLAHAAMTLLNALSIGLMASAVRGSRVLPSAAGALRSLGWGTLTHLIVGFLFVVLWTAADLGVLSAIFVLGPLVVAHWSIGREALARREHQETVTTFVAALEEADPVSAGHAARVAHLAELVGSALGLGGQQTEDLRYAALLHDIGLVTVRTQLPPDPEVEQTAYLSAISAHPEAGVAVLRGLDFLTGALPAIAHHHERYDGRGYPAGLEGETIPLAARIIAVADAYDALAGRRAGTPATDAEVLEELRSRAGTQLDPAVVQALGGALARRPGATPARATEVAGRPEDPAGGAPRGTGVDHDHPSVSDTFAEWQPEQALGARWR